MRWDKDWACCVYEVGDKVKTICIDKLQLKVGKIDKHGNYVTREMCNYASRRCEITEVCGGRTNGTRSLPPLYRISGFSFWWSALELQPLSQKSTIKKTLTKSEIKAVKLYSEMTSAGFVSELCEQFISGLMGESGGRLDMDCDDDDYLYFFSSIARGGEFESEPYCLKSEDEWLSYLTIQSK